MQLGAVRGPRLLAPNAHLDLPRSDADHMRCSLRASDLRAALTEAAHLTPSVPSQPAFAGVLLLVGKGHLTVVGSNGDSTLAVRRDAVTGSEGQALIQPKPLIAYLSTIRADTEVVLEGAGDLELAVTAGNANPYTFRLINATFPLPPRRRSDPAPVDFSRFAAALSAVRVAIGRENLSLQLVSGPDGLFLSATDNYRLARAHLPEAGFGEFSNVLSLATAEMLARVNVSGVLIEQSSRSLRFSGEHSTLIARPLSISFPAVDNVIDTPTTYEVALPVRALETAIQRLGALASGDTPVAVSLVGTEAVLAVENVDLGSGREAVELAEPAPTEISFLVKLPYLAGALSAFDAATVTLGFNTSLLPVFLRTEEPFPLVQVVMPMKH